MAVLFKGKASALRFQKGIFSHLLLASSNDVDGFGLIYSGFENSSGVIVIITVTVLKSTFFFYLVAMLSGVNHKIHLLQGGTSSFSQFKNIHPFIHFLLFIQFRDAVRLEPRAHPGTGHQSVTGLKKLQYMFLRRPFPLLSNIQLIQFQNGLYLS